MVGLYGGVVVGGKVVWWGDWGVVLFGVGSWIVCFGVFFWKWLFDLLLVGYGCGLLVLVSGVVLGIVGWFWVGCGDFWWWGWVVFDCCVVWLFVGYGNCLVGGWFWCFGVGFEWILYVWFYVVLL